MCAEAQSQTDPLTLGPVGLGRRVLLNSLRFKQMARAPGVFASALWAILRRWFPLYCGRQADPTDYRLSQSSQQLLRKEFRG